MRKAFGLLLPVVLLMGMGAHWVLLQGYAWASMAAAGQEAPCAVCLTVERGLSQEAPAVRAASPKVDFVLPAVLPQALASGARAWPRAAETADAAAAPQPLLPPPRALRA